MIRKFLTLSVLFAACNTPTTTPVTTSPTDGGSTTYSVVNVVGPDGAVIGKGIQSN